VPAYGADVLVGLWVSVAVGAAVLVDVNVRVSVAGGDGVIVGVNERVGDGVLVNVDVLVGVEVSVTMGRLIEPVCSRPSRSWRIHPPSYCLKIGSP